MKRRSANRLAALALLGVLAGGACNGGSEGPPLTDPTEIVSAALTATEGAKSVHIDMTASGSTSATLPGAGAGGGGIPVDLTGTTIAADIDLASTAAKVTIAAPSIFGFTGSLVAIDGKSYLKTSLTGPLYAVSDTSAPGTGPVDANGLIAGLRDLLTRTGVTLTKGSDVGCGSHQCYAVSTDLTAANLGLGGVDGLAGLPIDVAGAGLNLTVLVDKNLPHRLAGITAILRMAGDSEIRLDLAASKWDEPVTISAPPADQVKPAS